MSKRIIPAPPAVIPSAPELTPSQKATRDKLERRKRKVHRMRPQGRDAATSGMG